MKRKRKGAFEITTTPCWWTFFYLKWLFLLLSIRIKDDKFKRPIPLSINKKLDKVVAKFYMNCSLIVLGEFRTWELEKAHTSKSHTILDHQSRKSTYFWDLIKVIVRRRNQINLSPCFSKYFDKKIKRKNIWPKK